MVEGEIAALSRDALAERLSADGLLLVQAKVLGRGGRLSALGLGFGRGRRVKLSALISFIRELRSLVGSGLPLTQVLKLLEARKDDVLLAGAIRSVRQEVEQGRSLDRAMAQHPQVFDTLVQATVRAGAATGRLEPALDRLLWFLMLRKELERKLRKAMAYPTFLLALLFIVLALLMLFVLPRFADLYADFGANLPVPTQVLMAGVRAAPIVIPALVLALFLGGVAFRIWLRRPGAQTTYDRWRLGLPVFGPVARNTALIQLSFMMSMLLSAGMNLREALLFASSSLENRDFRARLENVATLVGQGRSLSDSLHAQTIYPDISASLLSAGETAGDLDRMFGEVAKLHEDTLEDHLTRALTMIEPAMMIIVGGVLGAVIIAVYLPIFGISAVVQ